ncbi:hypothetical protein [Pararobbsia alpina]|uniref:Uncharacterized protein n=1 Tax=Pararobbsia alpina TaxID=621374 RepID=A0A6S7B8X1_9BURK|nr:hypothetical protein [Pararobbsia alpina]CAB3781272.1 hypothetical protein LMG28138_01160 [Pararobbsia alpina]
MSIIEIDIPTTIEQDTDYTFDWRKYARAPQEGASATTDEPYDLALLAIRIDRLIDAFERPRLSPEQTLWSSEQIANWLGLSKQTVELRVVTRPGFPAALRPVDSKQAQRRWFAGDVMEWARNTAGTIPASRPGRRRKAA